MNPKSFSESLEKLQRAANEIGRPATSLEDSLQLFEEGLKEAEYLEKVLTKAEQQIQIYEEKESRVE